MKKHLGIISIVVLLFSLIGPIGTVFADPAVSGVEASDTDSTGYGLDGRDFHVTWTPGVQPDGYQGTVIIIVPAAVTVAAGGGEPPWTCDGGPCGAGPAGFFGNFSNNSFTAPQYLSADGQGNPWNPVTTYKICVFTKATVSEVACSGGFTATSDSVEDSQPPEIHHMSSSSYISGQKMTIYASIYDDQTTNVQFADNAATKVFMYYNATNGGAVTTQVVGGPVAGTAHLWKFETATSSNFVLRYYLKVIDMEGNIRYFTSNPSIDMDPTSTDEDAAGAAFIVNPVSAGAHTVSGTIRNTSGNPLEGAFVYLNGLAKPGVATGGDGTYSISSLPTGSYDVAAAKSGYGEWSIFENVYGNKTVNFSLNQGDYIPMMGGSGGGKPHKVFSSPPMSDMYAPPDGNILVGFDQALDSSTVNDVNPTDAGSNVYLTTDNGTTKIAGSVTYCPSPASPGCSSLHNMDTNVILFDPSENLTPNTPYTLVITGAVMSASGQSIEGNRPGGGEELSFNTGGEKYGGFEDFADHYGNGGQYMPPYVESVLPAPGMSIAGNSSLVITFNQAMNPATFTTDNIIVFSSAGVPQSVTVTADSSNRLVVVDPPGEGWASGGYEVRVFGAVSSMEGIPMRTPDFATQPAFVSNFESNGGLDVAAPSVWPMLATGSTNVSVSSILQYGFNKPLNPATLTVSNVNLKRGSTSTAIELQYNPGENNLYIIPNTVLAPNTVYTVSFTANVESLAGTAMEAQSFNFTTGNADTTQPKLKEARCDDYTCTMFFTEPMNHDTTTGENWDSSVLNPAMWMIMRTAPSVSDPFNLNGKPFSYDSRKFSVTVKGVAGLAYNDTFQVVADPALTDLSGENTVVTADSANSFTGKAENSANTYGSFGGGGMFGPPGGGGGMMGGGPGGEYKPEGFGSFTGEQFAFGNVDMAYPFNPMAGADSNVFQVRFSPGITLEDEDQITLTFPSGTGITNVEQDTFSPFLNDFNEGADGTITFDTGFGGGDGISVDAAANIVTVQLAVTGSPSDTDHIVMDLRKITNPAIPKGPDTSGYTVGIKVKRGGEVLVNKTSMPYFIMQGGTNTITVNIYAGSQVSPDPGANGAIYLFGGGPSGPMDKNVTLVDGVVSAVDGTAAEDVTYSNLLDGCYGINTEPNVTLGEIDYLGQRSLGGRMAPESICVNGGETKTKNIVLGSAGGGNSIPLIVKLAGIANFGGADIHIFGNGPGGFTKKSLIGVGAPNADGYILRLSTNGPWFVGVGPGMSKGPSVKMPTPLPGVPPPPVNLSVSGLGGTPDITAPSKLPPGVSFDGDTNTLTFTFAAADKAITGTVTDGTSPLSNVGVFVHSQGFGAPISAQTNPDGTFSLRVSDYGPYEIGVFKDGLPPRFNHIEVKPDGLDDGPAPDIFFKGKQITDGNPLVLKIKKPSYYISGKILDGSGNGIAYAPVFADDGNGNFANSGTSGDGSYTLFVDDGTWTVRSNLPPDKTDTCGTFSKTVTVSSANKTNQNVSPTAGTCYTITGTITIGENVQANVPVFIDEWDIEEDRPASNGFFRPTNTDSEGVYTAKVAGGGKTYRVGTWSPDYGEVSTTVVVTDGDETADITTTNGNITFLFPGGTSEMNAFVGVVKSDDKHTKISKGVDGLDSGLVLNAKEGTYNYKVNVFGVGDFTGTVDTGEIAAIDLSDSSLVTLSGHVTDGDGNDLKGALVTVLNTETGLTESAVADADGEYTMNVDAGTYIVSSSLSGYVPGAVPDNVDVLDDVTYNFEDEGDQPALIQAPYVIEGNIYQEGGEVAVSDGYVMAENNENGIIVTAPIDPQDGSYSLPVNDGTWAIKAVASMQEKVTDETPVTVDGSDIEGKDVTLVANAGNTSVTASQSLAADTGGTFNDADNTGVKVTADAGTLDSSSGDINLDVEKKYVAPETYRYQPLGNALYSVTATSETTDSQIKDLNGNVLITISYADLLDGLDDLNADETDLKCAYYSNESNEFVVVEGGYTVDPTNDTVTCNTSHLTDFALVVANNEEAPDTPAGLAAVAASSSRINLSWTAVDGATSYDIYRDTDPAGAFPRIGDEPTVGDGATTTYSDTELSSSTTYYYKISALNELGESAASGVSYAITLARSGGGAIIFGGGIGGVEKKAEEKVPAIEISNLVNVVTENYSIGAGGVVPATVTVSGGDVAVTLAQGVIVTDADGVPYVGEIAPPAVASNVTTSAPSGESIVGEIYEFGVAGKTLSFSKPVTLTLPLPAGISSTEDLSVYYLDEIAGKWILAGNGGKVMSDGKGGYVVSVDVTHLTKFVVMKAVEEKSSTPFVDLGKHFAKKYIESLYEKGIVSGYDATHFAPNNLVTRAELTKVAVDMTGIKTLSAGEIGADPFKDVPVVMWYGPYIHAASKHGIVSGYSGNLFKPNQSVMRAEALRILFDAAGLDVKNVKYDGKFSDVGSKAWYAQYVAYGTNEGILSGYLDGKFKPNGNLTRGEMARIVGVLFEKNMVGVIQLVFDAVRG